MNTTLTVEQLKEVCKADEEATVNLIAELLKADIKDIINIIGAAKMLGAIRLRKMQEEEEISLSVAELDRLMKL